MGILVFVVVLAIIGLIIWLVFINGSNPPGQVDTSPCSNDGQCASGNCAPFIGSVNNYCQPSGIANSGIQGATCVPNGTPGCNQLGLYCQSTPGSSTGTCSVVSPSSGQLRVNPSSGQRQDGTYCSSNVQCQSGNCAQNSGAGLSPNNSFCQPTNVNNSGQPGSICQPSVTTPAGTQLPIPSCATGSSCQMNKFGIYTCQLN